MPPLLRNQQMLIIGFSLFCVGLSLKSFAVPLQPQNGQLDSDRVFKLNATKVVQPSMPGVVGLNLLIFPTNYPLVQDIFPDTSAEQQGIQPGDRIVQINQEPTLGKSRTQIDEMISDKIGDRVHLIISRNQQLKTLTLTVLPAPAGY